MGNSCPNGTPGNTYTNYNRLQNECLASRFGDGNDDAEDSYSRSSTSSFAGFLRQSFAVRSTAVLERPTPNIRERYNLGHKLGHGKFAATYLCTEISTGRQYACKSISKGDFRQMTDLEEVRREIEIMHLLSGDENVVTIKEAYEDEGAVHIVMELCPGGELFAQIQRRGRYSERKAAEIIGVIAGVVARCHALGVMHRDLKPENFLLMDKDDHLSIKTIDFGLSVFFKPGEVFTEIVGSPHYVSPEVLKMHYGEEADVWTIGVILYVLLSGRPPFYAATKDAIFDRVLKGHVDLESNPWPMISDSAKDLVSKILCPLPSERLKAHEVLKHPWVCDSEVATDDLTLDASVLSLPNQFSAINGLKKLALEVVAERLSDDEIAGLREMFKAMDTENTGVATFGELEEGLRRYNTVFKDTEIRDLMKVVDNDTTTTINWEEFISAAVPLAKMEQEEHLMAAFTYFDKDGSGYITADKLQKACMERNMEDVFLEEMISEVDLNYDGQINYTEFVTTMQSNNFGLGWPRAMESSLNAAQGEAPEVH